jgi:hypothetical protein
MLGQTIGGWVIALGEGNDNRREIGILIRSEFREGGNLEDFYTSQSLLNNL